MKIKDIPESFVLVTDSQDVEGVLSSIGKRLRNGNSLFVEIEDGEYKTVYAFAGIVPILDKQVSLLYKG